ncbi:MAG: trypsin-like peptidase domain-containing protein [Actinomycetota bacterium]
MQDRVKTLLRTPFGSALLGGLVVAVLGWAVIATGLVKASSDQETALAPPLPQVSNAKASSPGTNTVSEIYRADADGVAFIEAERRVQQASPLDFFNVPRGGGTATGSGVVIDEDGHVLTNNHVVAGAETIRVKLGDSDTTHDATKVGEDPATDLALLKVDAPSSALHPLTLGDSSRAQVGDPVVAIGNPFGLDRTVTTGIVSALQRQIEAPNGFAISNVIQTDASINPGNSGGPLIDASGAVIGVTSQIETAGSGGSVGIGFAIPINTARDVVSQLQDGGEVQHAFLGITGTTISLGVADALNLPVEQGVFVQDAVKGGPADKAGIQGGDKQATIDGAQLRLGGDIITEVDGRRITSMDQVVSIVNGAKPGDTLDVTVLRSGGSKSFTVTLGDRPSQIRDSEQLAPSPFGR